MATTPGASVLVSDIITTLDDMRIILAKATDQVTRYFDTDLAGEVNALADGTTILTGTPISKNDMVSAITVLQQFQNFMNNEAVSTNTYRITVNRVSALKGQTT